MPDTDTQTNSSPSSSVEAPQLEVQLAVSSPGGKAQKILSFDDKGQIIIRDDITLQEWHEGLRGFKSLNDHYKESLSKYIAFGKLKFGQGAVDASLGQLEFDMPTVRAALDIGTIPLELRHESLTADHYVVLARADVTPKKRAHWAKVAVTQKLTPQQLKSSIDHGEVVSSAVSDKNTHGVVSIHGLSQEFDIWLRRVKGLPGILKMQPEAIEDIVRELAPMAKLHHDLVNRKSFVPKSKSKKRAVKKKPAKKKK